eukprot:gene2071-13031_t
MSRYKCGCGDMWKPELLNHLKRRFKYDLSSPQLNDLPGDAKEDPKAKCNIQIFFAEDGAIRVAWQAQHHLCQAELRTAGFYESHIPDHGGSAL